jgi:hypothetical protein
MTQKIINVGLAENDGTGDNLRNAFAKANDNFSELYNAQGNLDLSTLSGTVPPANGGIGLTASPQYKQVPIGTLGGVYQLANLVAGTGIAVDLSLGNLTITNEYSGGNVSGSINVLSTANSTSTSTGAVTIAGGLGVGGNIYAGNLSVAGIKFVASDGSPNQVLATDGYGQLQWYSVAGLTTTIFTGDVTGSGIANVTLTLANVGTITPGTYGSATQTPVVTVDSKGRISSITTISTSGGGGGGSTSPGGSEYNIQYNFAGGFAGASGVLCDGMNLTVNGVVYANGGVASTDVSSGSMQVVGGLGVTGNIYAGQMYFNGTNVAAAINSLSNGISVVSNALSVASANRVSADNALSVRIDTVSNAVSVVSQALSVGLADRISVDAALSVRIDTVSNAVSVVSQALSVETNARISAVDAVAQLLSAETADRVSAINKTSQALSVEINNRASADSALSLRIDAIGGSSLADAISVVSQALSVETANRISAVNVVSNAVSVVSQALSVETANRISAVNVVSNAVSVVSQALSVETANRISAVNVVSNAVSIETANRISAVNVVSNAVSVVSQALSVEIANRTSADNALSVRVDTVSNAVSVVSNALSLEIANRTSADNALSNSISALGNSVSVTYAPKANPTFTGSVTLSNITVSANNVSNIGTVSTRHNTIFATTFNGTATTAQYADLAEIYTSDNHYEYGTVVAIGGEQEITITVETHDNRVAGVISQNPAYLMNRDAIGLPVALTGRVPCKVIGPISKGDRLVSSDVAGHAQRLDMNAYTPGCIIGKALEDFGSGPGVIEILIGKV